MTNKIDLHHRTHSKGVILIGIYLKLSKISSFFPRAARIWNYLRIKCCLLTNDLNGFKSRINRHLLTVGFF